MDWPVEENCPCPCTVETMYENISQNFLIKNCAKKVEVAKKNQDMSIVLKRLKSQTPDYKSMYFN